VASARKKDMKQVFAAIEEYLENTKNLSNKTTLNMVRVLLGYLPPPRPKS